MFHNIECERGDSDDDDGGENDDDGDSDDDDDDDDDDGGCIERGEESNTGDSGKSKGWSLEEEAEERRGRRGRRGRWDGSLRSERYGGGLGLSACLAQTTGSFVTARQNISPPELSPKRI
ncbi:hypothetical protein TWF718_007941 [Orbilia javanica]|uniref:Uncharacterized protein n=1 Tax=Orbilia javanica TaxID=47235 RepID=A0AAN8RC19_9PEZI